MSERHHCRLCDPVHITRLRSKQTKRKKESKTWMMCALSWVRLLSSLFSLLSEKLLEGIKISSEESFVVSILTACRSCLTVSWSFWPLWLNSKEKNDFLHFIKYPAWPKVLQCIKSPCQFVDQTCVNHESSPVPSQEPLPHIQIPVHHFAGSFSVFYWPWTITSWR